MKFIQLWTGSERMRCRFWLLVVPKSRKHAPWSTGRSKSSTLGLLVSIRPHLNLRRTELVALRMEIVYNRPQKRIGAEEGRWLHSMPSIWQRKSPMCPSFAFLASHRELKYHWKFVYHNYLVDLLIFYDHFRNSRFVNYQEHLPARHGSPPIYPSCL